MNQEIKKIIEGCKQIFEIRGYKILKIESYEDCTDVIGEFKDESGNKKKVIARIPYKDPVGVNVVRDFAELVENEGYDHGMILAISRYTHYAKKEAQKAKLEFFPNNFAYVNLFQHYLVPKHEIATKEEIQALKEKYSLKLWQLPRLYQSDPVAKILGAKVGDVIKITRKSPTAGVYVTYRLVVAKEFY